MQPPLGGGEGGPDYSGKKAATISPPKKVQGGGSPGDENKAGGLLPATAWLQAHRPPPPRGLRCLFGIFLVFFLRFSIFEGLLCFFFQLLSESRDPCVCSFFVCQHLFQKRLTAVFADVREFINSLISKSKVCPNFLGFWETKRTRRYASLRQFVSATQPHSKAAIFETLCAQ